METAEVIEVVREHADAHVTSPVVFLTTCLEHPSNNKGDRHHIQRKVTQTKPPRKCEHERVTILRLQKAADVREPWQALHTEVIVEQVSNILHFQGIRI